jgi:enoyl-CoA hydratase/carnithine racemase
MNAATNQLYGNSNLILTDKRDGVTTLTMNNPARLNGWTMEMMEALKECFAVAARDDETRVLILTGTDPYYCAGVNLAATIRIGHPRKLHAGIIKHNQALFDAFLDFPKPLLVAVNGPAIGASVTSATLCDGIIASEKATFSTPFAALGVTPEGCSSVHFARIMGRANADRMLGPEGWKPTASEALEAGLVQWTTSHDKLREDSHHLARTWIASGAVRSYRAGGTRDELKAINAHESKELADAFLSTPFIKAQLRFLWSKKKLGPAATFLAMLVFRPIWSRFL